MLKNVSLAKNQVMGNFLILKLNSSNKNSLNSILKKFSHSFFLNSTVFEGDIYLFIKLYSYFSFFERSKLFIYLKKENIYFNVLGFKNKNNFISYYFFINNFNQNKSNFKYVIFQSYVTILIFYGLFVKLYFILNFFFSNFNLLIFFKCLQLNKQLLG